MADEAAVSKDTSELRKEVGDLRRKVESLAVHIGQLGAIADKSKVTELCASYETEADRHKKAWHVSLWVLVAATALAVAVGLAFIRLTQPADNASTAKVVSSTARDVLVVGLLLYAVRIAALQFRVHRHLEAVSRNKVAALKTFNRLVAEQTDSAVWQAMASDLARSVFSSAETGFIGTSEDNVTVIDRIAGSIPQRGTGG